MASLNRFGSGSTGYRNRQLNITSGAFTVPANTFQIEVWATGAGQAGQGCATSGVATGKNGGSAGSTAIAYNVAVQPGDVVTYVIGAGGVGIVSDSDGPAGGSTIVRIGNKLIAVGSGGPENNMRGSGSVTSTGYLGGGGGTGAAPGATAGTAGRPPQLVSPFSNGGSSAVSSEVTGVTLSAGGAAGTSRGPGGGGGSNMYGAGGNGAAGANTSGNAVAGGDAPATSYGAGGGGASGTTATTGAKGGNGANGCVEIYW